MGKKYKYYGTNIMIYGEKLRKLKELGYNGTHAQFRVVCKSQSRAEANRIAAMYGCGEKVFTPNYTSETGNTTEIELANEHEFIICLGGTVGNEYIGIKSIL